MLPGDVWGQLSQVSQLARGRGRGSSPALLSLRLVESVLHSPQTPTCSQVASQTRDVLYLVFAGSRPLLLQGHASRYGQVRTPLWFQV